MSSVYSSSFASRRRENFKKGLNTSDGRRRREDTQVKIRKDKREQGLQKRRAMANMNEVPATATLDTNTSQPMQTTASHNAVGSSVITRISELKQQIHQSNPSQQTIFDAVQGLRKMLSVETNPPVQEVIDSGILPILVQILALTPPSPKNENDLTEKIQFETSWALTNIASSDKTVAVVDNGAVPHLVRLTTSSDSNLREQCIWCLGNISGDSSRLRDIVLQNQAMTPLLQNITHYENHSLLGNALWTLSNFCRGKPSVATEYASQAIPVLASVIKQHKSIPSHIIVDACWALSYLSDGDDDRIQAVMDSGITPYLIDLLGGEESVVVTPCLRVLGNFVSGNDKQTQIVMDAGILSNADSLLNHKKKSIRKEAHWLLSNIAAGTKEQVTQLFQRQNIKLIKTTIKSAIDAQWEIRKEAIWVLSNICTGGLTDHIQTLVQLDVFDALCSVLTLADSKITMVAMEAIESILKVGKELGLENYTRFLDEADGIDKLEELQQHDSDLIYEKALSIIDKYLSVDEEIEDENLVPQIDGNQFVFGHSATTTMGKNGMGSTNENMGPLHQFNFQFQAN